MRSKLQIKTKYSKEDDAGQTPASPAAQYLNSKALSVSILAVLETEVPIDDSCTMQLLQHVFLPINPRFSSVMESDNKDVKHWKRVDVNLQDHVYIPSFPEGLSLESYDEHFDKYLTKIAMDPLSQDKPLWEIHITKYPTSKAAGHLIFKLHHALGDGFSLMGALLSCLQRADNPSLPLTFPSIIRRRPNSTSTFTKKVTGNLSAIYNTVFDYGWSVLKSSFIADDKTPIRSGGRNVEFRPVHISTVAFSIDQIKQIKTKLGVTISDIVTGIVFLGTRLYMQQTGSDQYSNSESTALVLLNTRNINGYKSVQEMIKTDSSDNNHKPQWGNQYTFLHVPIPELTIERFSNPLQFVYQAHKTNNKKKNSMAVHLTGQILEILMKLRGPEVASQYIHGTLHNTSMTISNMIDPVEQMSIANHPCKGLYFMSIGVPQSLTIQVMSYAGTLRIAIGAEEGFIDSQKFNSCIKSAFELIFKSSPAIKLGESFILIYRMSS